MGPASKPAKMHVERSEMLNLIQRWDSLGACTIIPLETKDFAEAVGIFTVDKDAFYFRLIINPKAINSCMASLSYITKELTPGSMLSLLSLKPGDMFRFFVLMTTWLITTRYCFQVTAKRAMRNAFRMAFQSSELKHLQCFRPEFEGRPLLVCLAILAMGDSLAVDNGQQAHKNALDLGCGSMRAHESLRYRSPIPRGRFHWTSSGWRLCRNPTAPHFPISGKTMAAARFRRVWPVWPCSCWLCFRRTDSTWKET